MILLLLLFIQANSQYSGCTFSKVADDNDNLPDGGGKFVGYNFPGVSENSVIAFTGHGPSGLVGLYKSNSANSLNYYISSKTSLAETGVQYTGLVRGCTAGTATQELIVYIARRQSGGPFVVLETMTGTARAFLTIATTSTTVPGRTYTFTDFSDSCVNSAGVVVFLAESSGGSGIYASTPSGSSRTLTKIADFTNNIPGTTTPYTYLISPRIGGNYVTFFGSYYSGSPPARPAIVLHNLATGVATTIATSSTEIPGWPGQLFNAFSGPGIDFNGNYVTFVGQGPNYWGVLKWTRSNGVLQNVADQATRAPGHTINFTGFQGTPSIAEDGSLCFRIVHEPDPMTGVWLWRNGPPYIQVAGVADVLPGIASPNTVSRISFGEDGYHGNTIAFLATLTSSSSSRAGVYRCRLASFDEMNTTRMYKEE